MGKSYLSHLGEIQSSHLDNICSFKLQNILGIGNDFRISLLLISTTTLTPKILKFSTAWEYVYYFNFFLNIQQNYYKNWFVIFCDSDGH